MFCFKQFNVDQTGCAMKINTDGVLLGALADADNPKTVLDIGTGTGVIALMLAQRFANACIDAVEIDEQAAVTAGRNFANSPFAERLNLYPVGFEEFFEQHPEKKYDLIVSNPPFYINSLLSPQKGRQVAKHADKDFFSKLVKCLPDHLNDSEVCCLILPPATSLLVKELSIEKHLNFQRTINVHSYYDSEPHREIVAISKSVIEQGVSEFVIYDSPKVYSKQFSGALKDFFTIF